MSDSINDLINALTTARLFLESSRASELQTLVQDPTASLDRFLILLAPSELAAIVLHGMDSDTPLKRYESLPMRLQEDARVLHILAREKVPDISKHPALEGYFQKWYKSIGQDDSSQDQTDEKAEAENHAGRIAGIAAAHLWTGEVGKLEPIVSLRFRDSDEGLLLETIASLPDMISVTRGMLEIVNGMATRLSDGHEKGAVSLELPSETRKSLSKVYQQAHDLEQIFEKLLPPESSPETNQSQSEPSLSEQS